jgi:hypothetical protein
VAQAAYRSSSSALVLKKLWPLSVSPHTRGGTLHSELPHHEVLGAGCELKQKVSNYTLLVVDQGHSARY